MRRITVAVVAGWPRWVLLFGAAGMASFFLGACEDFQTGPSLVNVVVVEAVTVREGLVPTTGDPSLCCCRVRGTVTNNNEVPVHVTIKWAAFENQASVQPFGRILHFVPDLEPSETEQFETPNNGTDASGFLVPCNSIGDLRREVDVNGIVFPEGS